MKNRPTKTWTRVALPLLFFIIGIVPAKAQLYLGGGFNYHTTEIDLPQSDVTYLSISPELGYRYHKLSAGLAFSHNTSTYSNTAYTDTKEYTIEPYIRYDIIVRNIFNTKYSEGMDTVIKQAFWRIYGDKAVEVLKKNLAVDHDIPDFDSEEFADLFGEDVED